MQILGETLEVIFRHIGLVRLDSATVWEIFFWLVPELITLPTTIIVYFMCRSLTRKCVTDEEDDSSLQQNAEEVAKKTVDGTVKVLLNETMTQADNLRSIP